MGILNIANRYANALIELALEKGTFDKVSNDIDLIFSTFKTSRELQVALSSPIVKSEKKSFILNEIFKDKVSNETLSFLSFIVEKNREDLLFDIIKRCKEIRDKKLGIINAEVFSSTELISEHKEKLKRKLEDFTKKKVKISFSLDKQLIGGFVVRIDDTVLDASIKHQLELLKEQFLKGSISIS
jgi:F-type H+-transporting ATPase subunit delta